VATGSLRLEKNRRDNLFFSSMAAVILIAVLIGFSQTFFVAPLPNVIVHFHAAVFSLWIVLLIVQTSLIVAGRAHLHRRLGLLGFGLACLVVIFGVLVATENLVRNFPGFNPDDHLGVGFKAFYAVSLSDILMFSTLIFFAFRKRFDPAAHKRLIIVATLAISDAAFDRWPIPVDWWGHRVTPLLCIYPLLLLLAIYDWWSMKRVQPVTLWASLFLVVVQQSRFAVGHTPIWQNFATWVLNHASFLH
jgi:hypothetical protein